LRLACAGSDHIDVGAATGKEDDKEREEAEPVALSAGSVRVCGRSLFWGSRIRSQGNLDDWRAWESKPEGPCSRVEDTKGHHLVGPR
jgi:hypothetical protein